MAQLKYLPAGIRLHLKEIFYKFTDNLDDYYFFHFQDIPTGLKAEKILKKKIRAKNTLCVIHLNFLSDLRNSQI